MSVGNMPNCVCWAGIQEDFKLRLVYWLVHWTVYLKTCKKMIFLTIKVSRLNKFLQKSKQISKDLDGVGPIDNRPSTD